MCLCSLCNEKKIHYAKGMCQKCYRHQQYIDNRKIELSRSNQYYVEHKDERQEYSRYFSIVYKKYNSIRNKKWRENHPYIRFLGNSYYLKTHQSAPPGYVWHHTCYDYADPEANIVLLSRSSHAMGHKLLRELGISIPCINYGGK